MTSHYSNRFGTASVSVGGTSTEFLLIGNLGNILEAKILNGRFSNDSVRKSVLENCGPQHHHRSYITVCWNHGMRRSFCALLKG
eukprot:scaffold2594_cov85-Cylindrotheca_fusiformis.AAC.7